MCLSLLGWSLEWSEAVDSNGSSHVLELQKHEKQQQFGQCCFGGKIFRWSFLLLLRVMDRQLFDLYVTLELVVTACMMAS